MNNVDNMNGINKKVPQLDYKKCNPCFPSKNRVTFAIQF